MSSAFLICPEPVREMTAGVGCRFRALAKVLAESGHQVTLAIPNDPQEVGQIDGVEVVKAQSERIGAQADGHDWVLLHAHLGNHYLSQRDDLPVVVDLYDPFLVENLHYHRELGFAPFKTDHATWRLQMERGDFFLCSSQDQRMFYLGWLGALGRVNPLVLEDDPSLERLIAEVPFGTPEGDPPGRPLRADVIDGLEDDAPLLYFGGIYDWFDPLVVLEALPSLLDSHPKTTVVFVDHPHPESTPLSVAEQAREFARRRGWLESSVRFEPWRPFERRFELAQVSDIAVVTHRLGLETDLSLRTRLVDLMWLGLPLVVSAGGTMAEVVERTGAGKVVPPGDATAIAVAVGELLTDEINRLQIGQAAAAWAQERTWKKVAAPLLEFAEKPRRDQYRDRFKVLSPGSVECEESLSRRVLRRLRQLGGRR